MTKDALIAAMRQREADRSMLHELQQALSAELQKPPNQQDLDAVDELTEIICRITGRDHDLETTVQNGLAKLNSRISGESALSEESKRTRKPKIRWTRYAAAAASIAGLVLAIHVVCDPARGTNPLFGDSVLMKDGFKIYVTENDSLSDAVITGGVSDPYEMRSVCTDYGIDNAVLPQYRPDNLVQYDVSHCEFGNSKVLNIYYHDVDNEKKQVCFTIQQYDDGAKFEPIGIPTESYHFDTEEIQGCQIQKVYDSFQNSAVFSIERNVYFLSTNEFSDEEFEKILRSFFPEA
ncbi:MAG: DUF4367 domain-containing protein [Oscillospiraceae bacterium]|nr:DUF4367 domain-containing protein [Oscillospiraceae bacterium]MCR4761133.1 DUF4367 domain-containing protein [Oscillospiraceae bacterium]